MRISYGYDMGEQGSNQMAVTFKWNWLVWALAVMSDNGFRRETSAKTKLYTHKTYTYIGMATSTLT